MIVELKREELPGGILLSGQQPSLKTSHLYRAHYSQDSRMDAVTVAISDDHFAIDHALQVAAQ